MWPPEGHSGDKAWEKYTQKTLGKLNALGSLPYPSLASGGSEIRLGRGDAQGSGPRYALN